MEYLELGKLVVAVISALGTIAVTSYNISQSKKFRAELLEKLDEAIKKKSKHATCEIFRLLHGLRMNYEDITILLEDDDVVKIIYALKKTPGMVTYSDGAFQYREFFKNKWVMLADKISSKGLTYIFGFSLIALVLVMAFTKGVTSLTAFIMVIGFSILLTVQLRQASYDKMVEGLVSKKT